MTDVAAPAQLEASEVPEVRSSRRTRVKTQRALESEHLEKLLTQSRSKAASGSPDVSTSNAVASGSTPKASKAPKKKRKGKKEAEVYCTCKSDGEDGRPMIECESCNDWFHFDCVSISPDEAERIQRFVCGDCEERTGEKKSYIYDINTFPSPSPPPGVRPPPKRKAESKKAVKSREASVASETGSKESSSDDDGSEAGGGASTSSSESDASDTSRPKKKVKVKKPASAKPSIPERKPSTAGRPAAPLSSRKPSSSHAPGALPPARAHVQKKMTEVVSTLFEGKLSEDETAEYARDVEAALWKGFKEVVNGKEAVGGRYKAQFNLLSGSLSRSLRNDMRESIVSGAIGPAQVGTLTSADLASAEQLKVIEAAKQAALEQTVKSREDSSTAIRLGRDGLERAEDFREKEMMAIQAAERNAREKEVRRESLAAQSDAQSPIKDTPQSPIKAEHGVSSSKAVFPLRRSESTDVRAQSPVVSTPIKSFDLRSAWGAADGPESVNVDEVEMAFDEERDQTQLDLTDIISNPEAQGTEDLAYTPEAEKAGPSDKDRFEARPVVWSGRMINPKTPNVTAPPLVMRHISTRSTTPKWDALLPQAQVEITGRMKIPQSLAFLSDSRMSPTKELITVALTIDPAADDEQKKSWQLLIDSHVADERHMLCFPHGQAALPPGGAREFACIPLRASDPSPEVTELIDGYDLPVERDFGLLIGFFVVQRAPTPTSQSAPPPQQAQPPTRAPVTAPAPVATPPSLPNAQLQALMASLNPAALQSVISPAQAGATPVNPIHTPIGAAGGFTPPPQQQQQPYYQGPPQHHHPNYPPQQYPSGPQYGHAYGQGPPPQQGQGYGPGPGYGYGHGHDDRRGWDDRGRERSPDRRGSRDNNQGRNRDFDRQRDVGWGGRGGRGGNNRGRGQYQQNGP